jgi:hypothetical protein
MALLAFSPFNGTLILASTAASAVTVQPTTSGGMQGLSITNMSTLDAYIAIGGSSSIVAAAPTTASSTGSFPLMQRSTRTITVPPNCWVSAITTAGQANLALTPGSGQ